VPARHGGEEFAVLFPETDVDGAFEAAERFRSSLAALELGDGRSLPRRVTASVGIAAGNADVDELLAAADRALYRAKSDGKNRVRVGAGI
jgi:diguanylate cyclase (GGDEF)-like protein